MRKKVALAVETPSLEENYRSWYRHKTEALVCSNGICYSGKQRIKLANHVVSNYDPDEYLLSHCSIIASVDTEDGPNDVKYKDYYIHPDYSEYVNHNEDAWEKQLLLASYKSFIGAENYIEHIQNPMYSKGKILDAVPRVVRIKIFKAGQYRIIQPVYIDILVATHRKYDPLVKDIISGRVDKMSMGCSIDFSICTKCGTIIKDEGDECSHILNEKGQYFIDASGNKRRIAELCGHRSVPNSCRFTEASWVEVPAFAGAERREVINADAFLSKDDFEKWSSKDYQEKLLKIASFISRKRSELNSSIQKKVASLETQARIQYERNLQDKTPPNELVIVQEILEEILKDPSVLSLIERQEYYENTDPRKHLYIEDRKVNDLD